MRLLNLSIVYISLSLLLLGLCSSFQRPSSQSDVQARWEWAKQHNALDSLLFYQDRLEEEWQAQSRANKITAHNQLFLAYVLQQEGFDAREKRALLERYHTSQGWEYAYRIQWHGKYGQQDSAYFYQSLLENLPKEKAALSYAYGQLAVQFATKEQKYREASNYLQQAERATENTQDSLELYVVQAQVYAALGQLEKATQAAIALVWRQQRSPQKDSIAMAAALSQLGRLYQQQGQHYKATVSLGNALNYLADRSGHSARIGQLWYELAEAYYDRGNKPLETILYLRNAIAKWEEIPQLAEKEQHYISVYHLLAKQFMAVEQLDSSQAYLGKASALQKNVFFEEATGHAIQAALYKRAGQNSAAGKALQRALDVTVLRQGKKGEAVAAGWLAVGEFYQEQKQWSESQKALTEALWALSWQARQRVLPPKNSLFSKTLALEIGNARVQTLLDLQAQSKYSISNEVLEAQLDYNLALLEELQAQQTWTKTLRQLALKTRTQVVEWQWRVFNKNAAGKSLEIAFVQADANRQTVVWDALQQHWEQNTVRTLVVLQQQIHRQQAQQDWYEQRIWDTYQTGDSTQLDWYRQQLAANNASRTLSRQELEHQYQRYYNWHYNDKNVVVDSLQTCLKTGDALLQYLEGEEVLYQFILTKDTLVLRRIAWEEYKPMVRKYASHFTNTKMKQHLASGGFQDFCRTGHSLYYRLVHHELFKKGQRLIIIPDGLLQQLPFETLLTEIPLDSIHKTDFGKLDYLLKSKRVHYHYSSRLWWQSWQLPSSAPNNELLALSATYDADKKSDKPAVLEQLRQSLPKQTYMPRLVDSLSEYYAGDFYTNRYSSEYYYKDYVSSYGLLYLGFYGYNGGETGDLPSLLVAEDGYAREDNLLSLYEIQAEPMQANLVLLGNVYQGRAGEQQRNLLALGSSFLYAGSKAVVLPLWQQDSTAVQVVRYYYEGLQKGLENDEALRQAKLQYLQAASESAAHPSNWAGYVLIGNQQTIKVAAPITYIWWFVIPIAFIGFLGWWSLRALRQKR